MWVTVFQCVSSYSVTRVYVCNMLFVRAWVWAATSPMRQMNHHTTRIQNHIHWLYYASRCCSGHHKTAHKVGYRHTTENTNSCSGRKYFWSSAHLMFHDNVGVFQLLVVFQLLGLAVGLPVMRCTYLLTGDKQWAQWALSWSRSSRVVLGKNKMVTKGALLENGLFLFSNHVTIRSQ